MVKKLLKEIKKEPKKRIFFDYASTTPVHPLVLKEMEPFFTKNFFNPSAVYKEGVLVKGEVDKSRKKVANIIGANVDEIIFTSSGTESINLAIKGIFEQAKGVLKKPHFVTSVVEHPAVLETMKFLEKNGAVVSYVHPDEKGIINPEEIYKALRPETVLVSIIYAGNELGTIEPIKEISKQIKNYKQKNSSVTFPLFHTDASQAGNYLLLDVRKLGVDLMSIDGSKIYGPKGSAVLFAKRGLKISSQIQGGGQEKGRRSGTENVPAIIGFAKALEIAEIDREKESKRISLIRDFTWQRIHSFFPEAILNGGLDNRLPNNLNICFPGIDGEFLVFSLDAEGIACSAGSTCQNLSGGEGSSVVNSVSGKKCYKSSIRISFGRDTSKKDAEIFILKLCEILKN